MTRLTPRIVACATTIALGFVAAPIVGMAAAAPDTHASDKAGAPGAGANARPPGNPGNGNGGGGNGGGNSGGATGGGNSGGGNSGGGNSGGGNSGGGNGGGGNPITSTPTIPGPPAPVTPGSPAAPRNPIAPGNSGGGGKGGAASGGGRAGSGASGSRAGGTVPKGVPTSGLRAGRGVASIAYFVDFNDVASASAHLAIIPSLLSTLSAQSLGTITLRPLMLDRSPNSTEAACALMSSSQQNRAWVIASALATARVTTDGDWLSTVKLRSIGRRSGVAVERFVQGATSRSCYRKLVAVREEALALQIVASPTYVVKGPNGSRTVSAPASASEVLAAVRDVS